MDRLKAMTVLTATVNAGSLSGAGRRLNMPLPSVSRIISDLEAHLHTRLLNRSTRRIALTEAGAAYLSAARSILDQVEEAERAAGGAYSLPRGELTITAPILFGRLHVLPLVTQFLQDHAAISIRLVLSDRSLHLLEDQVDAAFRIGVLPDSALVATRLGAVRRVTCAAPAYLSTRGVPATPDDLVAHDCISFTAVDAPTVWHFPAGAVHVIPRLVVNTAEAAIDAAVAGLGVTHVLSYQIEPALEAKRLRILFQDFEKEILPVHFVHDGQGPLTARLRAFLDFTAPRLKARLVRLDEIAKKKSSGA